MRVAFEREGAKSHFDREVEKIGVDYQVVRGGKNFIKGTMQKESYESSKMVVRSTVTN